MAKRIDFQKAAKRAYQEQQRSQWFDLLDEIGEVVKLKPWHYVQSSDTFAYLPQNGSQEVIFYNCVHQDGVLGIVIYPSENAFYNVLRGEQSGKEERRQLIELESYTIYLGDKEQVPASMQKVFEKVGVEFGDGMWPWIACKHRGYMTSTPSQRDVAFLTDCMRHFVQQLKALILYHLNVEFDKGEMLMHLFNEKKGVWESSAVPFLPPQETYPLVIMRESNPQMKTLRACPPSTTAQRMELEFGWKPDPVQDEEGTTPYFPIVVAVANRITGEPIAAYNCRPEDLNNCAYTLWAEAIENCGMPETLYVSKLETAQMFEDFAKKLGVKLKQVKRLSAAMQILRNSGTV